MESEVQEEAQVPRSELDTAFSLSRPGRWMVVQSMSTTPWGYELHPLRRSFPHINNFGIPVTLGLPEDWQRDPRDAATEGDN